MVSTGIFRQLPRSVPFAEVRSTKKKGGNKVGRNGKCSFRGNIVQQPGHTKAVPEFSHCCTHTHALSAEYQVEPLPGGALYKEVGGQCTSLRTIYVSSKEK